MNRFHVNAVNQVLTKLLTTCTYQNEMEIQRNRFKLVSLICHEGQNIENGHYFAVVKKETNNFYLCDDV